MSFIRHSASSLPPVALRLDHVHRAGAAVLGTGLCVFGMLGFLAAPAFLSTEGVRVLGMGSNGLLSLVSLVVGAVLAVAACRGGTISSTLTVVVGVLFLAAGLLGTVVLGGPFNLLGFRWPNVAFSLACGTALLFTGSYGRFTAGLPSDNPYYQLRHPHPVTAPRDAGAPAAAWWRTAAAAAEMADAERAVAQGARGAECARVRALVGLGTHESRLRAWLADRESSGAT